MWTVAASGRVQSLFADIHSLPNEILIAIFKAGSLFPLCGGQFPFLLLVASVNRHWRDVAINSPNLWTNVIFSPLLPVKAVPMWIDRSKSCLLDVDVDLRLAVPTEASAIRNIISPHVGRCRS